MSRQMRHRSDGSHGRRARVLLSGAIGSLCLWVVLGQAGAAGAEDLSALDRGHRLLIQHGLQLMAVVDRDLTQPTHWENSNFTTLQFSDFQTTSGGGPIGRILDLAEMPNAQWARVTWVNESHPNVLHSAELPNLSRLTMLQYRDEQNLGLASELTLATETLAAWRTIYPDAIGYTNQWGEQLSLNTMFDYMLAAEPDMLFFDRYVFSGVVNDDDERGRLYRHMEKYRQLGLLGNDLTGDRPIPVGMWTQNYVRSGYTASQSETNLQYFGAFAFGLKALSAFTYARPLELNNFASPMFQGANDQGIATNGLPFDTDPLPMFYDVAEANRQALNLGPSLVRLLSTDLRVDPGLDNWGNTNYTGNVRSWDSATDPYITAIAAVNNGSHNNGNRGDVIVGYFQPLLEGFEGDDDLYFMIVNGLSGPARTSAETEQTITIDFDFGASGIDSLMRLSRETGEVELIDDAADEWTHLGGSQYQLALTLGGGIGDLFKLNTGNPFVGPPDDSADFDLDNDVDGDDLLLWQRHLGGSGPVGDANHDQLVDEQDLQIWQMQFNTTTPAASPVRPVPEPTVVTLMGLAAWCCLAQRRGR